MLQTPAVRVGFLCALGTQALCYVSLPVPMTDGMKMKQMKRLAKCSRLGSGDGIEECRLYLFIDCAGSSLLQVSFLS